MRALLLVLAFLPLSVGARSQEDDEAAPIQRYLVGVQLGDEIESVRRVYPPAQEWPSTVQARTGVTRYRLQRGMAKAFPARTETLFLGFKKGRLVEIEVVYDEKKSRAYPIDKLAGDYALIYGEAHRTDDRFWWSDGKTILRVFPAEIPVTKDGARAVAWRTAVQVFEHRLAGRAD